MTTQMLRTRRLAERLRALRHMPPGNTLSLPSGDEMRDLATDLLQLADDEDVVRWLQDERADIIARLALHWALVTLRDAVIGMRRAQDRGVDIPAFERTMLGELLNPDRGDIVVPHVGSDAGPALVQTLRRVQQHRGNVEVPEADQAPSEDLALCNSLISLPTDANPLAWIMSERATVAAILALRSVLADILDRRGFTVGPIRSTVRPGQVIAAGKVRVSIDEVVFGTHGVQLAVTTRIDTSDLKQFARAGETMRVKWAGFDRAVDDKGYYYPLRRQHSTSSDMQDHTVQLLTMMFFPAADPPVKHLVFSARPVTLELSAGDLSARPNVRPDIDVARELSWQVDAPGYAGEPA